MIPAMLLAVLLQFGGRITGNIVIEDDQPIERMPKHQGCYGTINSDCAAGGGAIILTRPNLTCANKSRFLLMSEDGKWHCLKL